MPWMKGSCSRQFGLLEKVSLLPVGPSVQLGGGAGISVVGSEGHFLSRVGSQAQITEDYLESLLCVNLEMLRIVWVLHESCLDFCSWK